MTEDQHVAPAPAPPPSTAARTLQNRPPPGKIAPVVAFDLETTGSDRLWTDASGSHVRIAGAAANADPVRVTTDIAGRLAPMLAAAGVLVGHNILSYDLIAMARDVPGFPTPWQLADDERVHDTKLVASLLDPPSARMSTGEAKKYYALDAIATRLGHDGKSGDLKKMAQHYRKVAQLADPSYSGNGFELIPLENPDFLRYLRQDVVLARWLADLQGPLTDYAKREHRVVAIASMVSLNGFRVDRNLLAKRIKQGQAKRQQHLRTLIEVHGLPETKADGKPAKAPQSTKEGKRAIVRAFEALGVPHDGYPVKPETMAPDMSQLAMDYLTDKFGHLDGVVELADVVRELNGVRPIYETIEAYLADDRVHPMVETRQASGRWSVTQPGMTVVGKRRGRVTERAVFLAEPGEVILAVDLAQIDARAVAVHSQDERYIRMFDPGSDLHTWVAQQLWKDPKRRQDAKVLAHGWNYGMGVPKLAASAGIPYEDAAAYDAMMIESFPGLVEWKSNMQEKGAGGELLDNGFGRLMKVEPYRAWTQAPALMGQGTARDLMMEALLRLSPSLHCYMRVQVHDEMVFSVPKHSADDLKHEIEEAFTFEWCPPHGSIPINVVCDATIGGVTWASAYEKS